MNDLDLRQKMDGEVGTPDTFAEINILNIEVKCLVPSLARLKSIPPNGHYGADNIADCPGPVVHFSWPEQSPIPVSNTSQADNTTTSFPQTEYGSIAFLPRTISKHELGPDYARLGM